MARNIKDTILSYLHHARLNTWHNFKGSQDDFIDYFVNDERKYDCNIITYQFQHIKLYLTSERNFQNNNFYSG